MLFRSIIGILAAVAIPAYQDYVVRAQISESVSLVAGSKTPLSEYFNDKGYWPAAASEVLSNRAGKYVSVITLAGATSSTGTISVEARLKDSGINSAISGRTLVLTTSDGKQWSCTAGNVATAYRPASCRA